MRQSVLIAPAAGLLPPLLNTFQRTNSFTAELLVLSPSPHPFHTSATSAGNVIDVLSSTRTAENCFKSGISTFSLSNLTSASRCKILRNMMAHSGVKRWLIADSVTCTSLLPPIYAKPLKRRSGSCQNPKIIICTNVTTSSFPFRFTAPISYAIS